MPINPMEQEKNEKAFAAFQASDAKQEQEIPAEFCLSDGRDVRTAFPDLASVKAAIGRIHEATSHQYGYEKTMLEDLDQPGKGLLGKAQKWLNKDNEQEARRAVVSHAKVSIDELTADLVVLKNYQKTLEREKQ